MIALASATSRGASPVDRALEMFDELEASGAPMGIVTVPLGAARTGAPFLPLGLGPITRWEDPAREADGRAWSFLGAGAAAIIEADGEEAIGEVARSSRALLGAIARSTHPEATSAPTPRLFGGVAFRAGAPRSAEWSGFRDASFVLPRWLVGWSGDRAFLSVARRAGEAIDRDALARIVDGQGAERRSLESVAAGDARVRAMDLEVWTKLVDRALASIARGELEKVVVARSARVDLASPLDASSVLEHLARAYPDCTRFALERAGAVFAGASPERLVQKRGVELVADALAGSTPRAKDASASDDARARAALVASDKDRREHRAVVDAIATVLRAVDGRFTIPETPGVRTLKNVHHLHTPIHAVVPARTHVLDLVRRLHPTPAVCGTPRDRAHAWIAANEPEPRGWYAGAVGWFDGEGDGAFSVAIRSGLLASRHARLYAGAGIVDGSEPTLEFLETRAKLAPMLGALGATP